MYLDENVCHFSASRGTLTFVSPYFGTAVRLASWGQHCQLMLQGVEREGGLLEEDFPLFTADVLHHMPEHPVSRYAATLPPEVVAVLVHYEVDQLSMLQLCAASPRGVQLLHSAPNLLWLIAPDMVRASGGACDKIHEMLGCTHEELLQWMEPAPGPFVLEFLAQVPPPRILDDARGKLLRMLKNPACCDIVRQRGGTSWEMLGVMEQYRALVGIKAARDAAIKSLNFWKLFDDLQLVSGLYADTVRLGRALRVGKAHVCAARCHSIGELKALHALWRRQLHAAQEEELAITPPCFPAWLLLPAAPCPPATGA